MRPPNRPSPSLRLQSRTTRLRRSWHWAAVGTRRRSPFTPLESLIPILLVQIFEDPDRAYQTIDQARYQGHDKNHVRIRVQIWKRYEIRNARLPSCASVLYAEKLMHAIHAHQRLWAPRSRAAG